MIIGTILGLIALFFLIRWIRKEIAEERAAKQFISEVNAALAAREPAFDSPEWEELHQRRARESRALVEQKEEVVPENEGPSTLRKAGYLAASGAVGLVLGLLHKPNRRFSIFKKG